MSVPDQILPSTNAALNSGVNWSRSGDTYTTTGQFASIIFEFAPPVSGKIYFEIACTTGAGASGWYFGIQRTPTRTGNFHPGTSTNGNGAAAVTFTPPTNNVRHGVLVDLDAATIQVDGGTVQTLPGTGTIYFGIYDGASAATGSGTLFYKTNTFNNPVPAGFVGWYDSLSGVTAAPEPGTSENPFVGVDTFSDESIKFAMPVINTVVLSGNTDVVYAGSTFLFDLFLEKSGRVQVWTDS
jgi:hypothetical protein